MPITVTIGTEAFFSACSSSTRLGRQSLGVGGADVVLRQHLQHRGARDAGDQRHVGDAERQRRQDQALGPRPQPLGDRPVALHRQPAELAPRTRRSARSRRETPAWRSPCTANPITSRSTSRRAFQAASTPSGMARHTATSSVDSVSDSVGSRRCSDQPAHRQVGEDRGAEIALQHAGEPDDELLEDRPVEAELAAHARRSARRSRPRRR